MSASTPLNEVEVRVKPDTGRAIIDGKTAVPFQSFVTLVLQRKVQQLGKQWGREPIIVTSELLTQLASAPQDTVENRAHVITVSMGVGVVTGLFCSSVLLMALAAGGIIPGIREYAIVAGSIIGLTVLVAAFIKIRGTKRGEKLVNTIENLSHFMG